MRRFHLLIGCLAIFLSACYGRTGVVGLGFADGQEGEECRRDADCQLGLDCIRSTCTDPTTLADETEREQELTCEAIVLGSNLPATEFGSTGSESNLHSGSCGRDDSPEAVYSFRLESAATVDIVVFSDVFDPTVYLRTGCDPETEIACGHGYYYAGYVEIFTSLDPGLYYVFVEGIWGEYTTFELYVSAWTYDY